MKTQYLQIRILLLFIVFGAFSCEPEEEVASMEYPRLETLDTTEITNNRVLFNGKVISKGHGPIMEYGFVWGQFNQLTYENSAKVSEFQNIDVGEFSLKADTTFVNNATYYVKGFLKTKEYMVYGNARKFTVP